MRGLLICLFALFAGPAFADTTAVYEAPVGNFRMTIEIAANGDVRGDVAGKPGVYILTRNGQGYVVLSTPTGPVVDRLDDLAEAFKLVVAERLPQFGQLAGARATDADGPYLVKGEDIVVRGRTGTPWYFAGGGPETRSRPVMVISHDPELAPLAHAMAHQFELSSTLQPPGPGMGFALEVEAIVKHAAPLAFGGAELATVSHSPIAPDRFALPGPVESRAAIIDRLRSTATDHSVTAF